MLGKLFENGVGRLESFFVLLGLIKFLPSTRPAVARLGGKHACAQRTHARTHARTRSACAREVLAAHRRRGAKQGARRVAIALTTMVLKTAASFCGRTWLSFEAISPTPAADAGRQRSWDSPAPRAQPCMQSGGAAGRGTSVTACHGREGAHARPRAQAHTPASSVPRHPRTSARELAHHRSRTPAGGSGAQADAVLAPQAAWRAQGPTWACRRGVQPPRPAHPPAARHARALRPRTTHQICRTSRDATMAAQVCLWPARPRRRSTRRTHARARARARAVCHAHRPRPARCVRAAAGRGDRGGAAGAERRRQAPRRPALLGELGAHVLADHGARRAPRGRVPQRALWQRRGRGG